MGCGVYEKIEVKVLEWSGIGETGEQNLGTTLI